MKEEIRKESVTLYSLLVVLPLSHLAVFVLVDVTFFPGLLDAAFTLRVMKGNIILDILNRIRHNAKKQMFAELLEGSGK